MNKSYCAGALIFLFIFLFAKFIGKNLKIYYYLISVVLSSILFYWVGQVLGFDSWFYLFYGHIGISKYSAL